MIYTLYLDFSANEGLFVNVLITNASSKEIAVKRFRQVFKFDKGWDFWQHGLEIYEGVNKEKLRIFDAGFLDRIENIREISFSYTT